MNAFTYVDPTRSEPYIQISKILIFLFIFNYIIAQNFWHLCILQPRNFTSSLANVFVTTSHSTEWSQHLRFNGNPLLFQMAFYFYFSFIPFISMFCTSPVKALKSRLVCLTCSGCRSFILSHLCKMMEDRGCGIKNTTTHLLSSE